MQTEQSLSIANPNPIHTSTLQKAALAAISVGVLMLLVAWASSSAAAILPPSVFLTISLGLVSVGAVIFVRRSLVAASRAATTVIQFAKVRAQSVVHLPPPIVKPNTPRLG